MSGDRIQKRAVKLGAIALVLGVFAIARATSASVSVSFQNGVNSYAGTEDTVLAAGQGGDPNTNYGNDSTLAVFEREVSLNNFRRVVMRFDLSSLPTNTPVYG